MTHSLWLAVAAIALALVQIGLSSLSAKRQVGNAWSIGPRDRPVDLVGLAGRLERAHRNLMESLPLFLAAVLIAHVTEQSGTLTLIGAHMYFWARVAYVPAYASGIPGLRTVFWQISMIGIVLILADLV